MLSGQMLVCIGEAAHLCHSFAVSEWLSNRQVTSPSICSRDDSPPDISLQSSPETHCNVDGTAPLVDSAQVPYDPAEASTTGLPQPRPASTPSPRRANSLPLEGPLPVAFFPPSGMPVEEPVNRNPNEYQQFLQEQHQKVCQRHCVLGEW